MAATKAKKKTTTAKKAPAKKGNSRSDAASIAKKMKAKSDDGCVFC